LRKVFDPKDMFLNDFFKEMFGERLKGGVVVGSVL
jgi:hypothetical protein